MRPAFPFFLVLLACSSSSSGSATNPAEAFVGTWNRAGTVTTTCTGGQPMMSAITGTLTLSLGSDSGALVAMTTDANCPMGKYTVSGNVATAANGTCMFTNAAGNPATLMTTSRTLTLSADGKTIAESGTATNTIMLPSGMTTTCMISSSGTYTKQ